MQTKSPFLHADVDIVRAGPGEFVLINRRTDTCFSIGAEERHLVDLLGRTESLDDVLSEFEARFQRRMTKRHLLEFIEQLRQAELLDEKSNGGQKRHGPERAARAQAPWVDSPDQDPTPKLNYRFDLLAVLLSWVLHPICVVPILVLFLLAANVLLRNWKQGLAALADLLDAYPLPLFLLLFVAPRLLLLNLIQALLVGMACRRFGGRVRGFRLRLWEGLIPMFQTDIGDSMLLMDDRGRRTMIFLGFWCPLFIGSACVLGWAMADPVSGFGTLCLLFVAACLIRLLIHCDVFLGFSTAYLALCNAVTEWQLQRSARAETMAWLARRRSPCPLSDNKRFWLRLYGLAYYGHRVLLTAILLVAWWYWMAPRYQLMGTLAMLTAVYWINRDLLRPQRARS